jgi:hypothetical protein
MYVAQTGMRLPIEGRPGDAVTLQTVIVAE